MGFGVICFSLEFNIYRAKILEHKYVYRSIFKRAKRNLLFPSSGREKRLLLNYNLCVNPRKGLNFLVKMAYWSSGTQSNNSKLHCIRLDFIVNSISPTALDFQ
jgi:hypothetical protein